MKISIALQFNDLGYVGKPFWPEITALIDISHDVHPKLGDAKKAAAIAAACEKRGITPEQYAAILDRSTWPFYTADETRGGEIVIPARVFQSFLNHVSQEAPKAIPKIQAKGLTFVGIKVSDGNGGKFLRTGKTEKDKLLFQRLVVLEMSNQRSLQTDAYIADFTASGILDIDEQVITADKLRALVEYGGHWYGIGSCRPQGYGRFVVTRWDEI
jgi:hypothetical protein